MPRVIEALSSQLCSLDQCADAIADIGFDPQCPDRTDQTALWLRRLTNNRTFLADYLIEQLEARHREAGIDSGYGPQAIILSPMMGHVFLRANIWPAASDLCFQTSGAKNFVYGVPHDHNFSFLTSGYCGPGYASDYYEYDYGGVAGYPGEDAKLRKVERAALHQGKIMLYRAHRDVHSQIPPESLSVSLNVMHVDPSQQWFDQYGFDLETGTVSCVLSPNSTEAFLRVAVSSGSPRALEFAEWVGRSHPSDRLRLASFEARALQCQDYTSSDALWSDAERSGSRMLKQMAQKHRAKLKS